MPKHNALKTKLTRLAKLRLELDKQGGPSENGRLYELILQIEDDILNSLGLPLSAYYGALTCFPAIPTNVELEERIGVLHSAATDYLLSHAKPAPQVLREAQENESDVMYVLPELKIPMHVYTIFVYNDILLKGKENVENVLHELRLCNQPEVLNALGTLYVGTPGAEEEQLEFLRPVGLKYLHAFINQNKHFEL